MFALGRKRRIKKTYVRENRNLKDSGPLPSSEKRTEQLLGADERYWAVNLPEKKNSDCQAICQLHGEMSSSLGAATHSGVDILVFNIISAVC